MTDVSKYRGIDKGTPVNIPETDRTRPPTLALAFRSDLALSKSTRLDLGKMVWICDRRNPKTKLVKEERTALKQKLCYGVGHVFNDLCIQAFFSYVLIYFTKVAKLSATGAGYIFVAAQIADAISTPFIGYGCDKVLSKTISRKYGNRKIWHLMGSVGIAFIWPFVFSPCLVCEEDSPTWVPVTYYGVLTALFSVCWPMVEISHLSLMPHVAKHRKDAVELSALRSALKLGCGVYVYVVTWILLGQNSEETVDESVQKPFTYQTLIVVLTGCVFALIFHWGVDDLEYRTEQAKPRPSKATPSPSLPECKDHEKQALEIQLQKQDELDKEINCEDKKKTWKQWIKMPDFYKMIVTYMVTQNVVNLSQSYFPMYLTETLHFRKEAIAYFPLIILISGILTSYVVKKLNRHFSNRVLFCAGAVAVVSSATWFYFTPQSLRNMIYAPTVIMGCGNSMLLVTSLAMVADMIGNDKKSSGFVYGVMALVDKTSLGLIVLGLQENYPKSTGPNCPACAEYLRSLFSVFPGVEALLGFLVIALLYKPTPQQRGRRLTIGKEINQDADFGILPYLKSTEV